MGLKVRVYRAGGMGDSTLGGISSCYDRLTVVNVDGPFDPSEDAPAVILTTGPMNTVRLIPAVFNDLSKQWEGVDTAHGEWVMYGGNAASTSDSRWSRAVKDLVGVASDFVKIFDRVEA